MANDSATSTLLQETLTKINEKVQQLKTNGLLRSDLDILSQRLSLAWREPPQESVGSTAWRKTRASRVYTDIQNANNHLFLSAILVIPPSTCVTKSFDVVLSYLTSLEDYSPYGLNLNTATQKSLESMIAGQGFAAASSGCLNFMQALFPQCETNPISPVTIVLTLHSSQPTNCQTSYMVLFWNPASRKDGYVFWLIVKGGQCLSYNIHSFRREYTGRRPHQSGRYV
jgi:hypothetical protein